MTSDCKLGSTLSAKCERLSQAELASVCCKTDGEDNRILRKVQVLLRPDRKRE